MLAHELAHVKNRDILISSVAATLAGAIMMIARIAQFGMFFGGGHRDDDRGGNPIGMLLMAILAPIAAMLIQLAISRSREYAADETGARMIGHGDDVGECFGKTTSSFEKNAYYRQILQQPICLSSNHFLEAL